MDVENQATLGSIQILAGPLKGRTFPIRTTAVTIGRETNNDIVLLDQAVSRRHARLRYHQDGQWHIEKLAPNNMLRVNQQDVQQAVIHNQDIIDLGKSTSFRFLLSQNASSSLPPASTARANTERVNPERAGMPPRSPIREVTPYSGGMAGPPQSPPQQLPTVAVSLPLQPANVTPQGTQVAFPLIQQGNNAIPSLEISTNTGRARQIYQLTKPVINIGRDPSNEIVINEPTVSSFHAQIVRDENQLVLLHPHPSRPRTANGLMYQGQIIAGDQPFRRPLKRGDIFRIGDEHGTLVTLTFNDGTGAPQEALPTIRPIPLHDALITVGRLPDNQVVLNHPQVSAHHARLVRDEKGYRIVDLDSTNHVYVNAQQVKNQQLKVGDVIRIGPFKLTFTGTELTQQDESSGIRIDALHVQKSGNKKVVLLNDISLVIPPRSFVALVGGSGAGKSTLMDAINGLRPAQKGTIYYNGQDYYRNLAAFSTQLGYVPQDDIIHRDLSVERALYYAARLRLPDDFTRAQIKQRIDEVLEDVEMKNRRKLLVSKLSGGQRKRVSIALELLANPSLFFLDEPTSGLDPGLDRKMMLLLRRLADKGHTIVLVTHATSNINVCDYICFLTQGGRMAYYGPPNEARAFFGKSSFAEIYTALEPTDEHPEIPAEAEARFKASPDYQRYVQEPLQQGPSKNSNVAQQTANIQAPRRGKLLKQFFILSLRYLELLKNDVGNLLILLLQAPVIAIILLFMAAPNTFAPDQVVSCPTRADIQATSGPIVTTDCQRVVNFLKTPNGQLVIASQGKSAEQILQASIVPSSGINAQEILFIMSFAAVMFGCINAAREIVKEGAIYRRERAVNLGIAPYMLSKCVVLGLLCLLQSAILVLLVNAGIPFHQGIFLPVLLEVYITLALTSLAGLMLGLAVSTIAPNTDRAMSFVPILLIPQVIFSGIIFTLNGVAAQAFAGIFAARWAIAGLGSSIGLHADKLGVDSFAYCGTLFSTCSQSQAISHLITVWSALVAMILLLGLVVAFFLKRKDIRK